MQKIIKGIILALTLAYPFLVILKPEFLRYIAFILAIAWAFNALLDKKIFFIVSGFFIFVAYYADLKFLYPVMVNLIFLIIFASSLKGEAIITKLAKIKNPNLPQQAIIYTRNLTKIWIAFFIFNGLICFLLPFINEMFWAFYCGVFSYILMAILFVGEILARKFIVND